MKNLFKYIGISAVLLFGFYYTEKMSSVVMNNNKLVKEIRANSIAYEIVPVSAIINESYIIPGLNGYTVNVLKSYDNMRFLDTFNAYYLEYDIIKPSISLDNNKDKIIKYGNNLKNSVAIIVKDNLDVIKYAIEKNIIITRIVNKDTIDNEANYEQINGDIENYLDVEKYLNKNKKNKNICYVENNILNICQEKLKYLVEASLVLNNYNLSTIKDSIKSGSIIYINDNVSLSDFKILVRQIYYQDLNVISLSNLIKEERD